MLLIELNEFKEYKLHGMGNELEPFTNLKAFCSHQNTDEVKL